MTALRAPAHGRKQDAGHKQSNHMEAGAETPGKADRHPVESAEGEVRVLSDQLLLDETHDREMAEEFICKICLVNVVGCQPQLTSCSHIFCGDCIGKWLVAHPASQSWAQRAQTDGAVPCPVCKEPLQSGDLHAVREGGKGGSGLLWQLRAGLRIRCAHSAACQPDGGRCGWVGELRDYQEHIHSCANLPACTPPSPRPAVLSVAEAETSDLSAPAEGAAEGGSAAAEGTGEGGGGAVDCFGAAEEEPALADLIGQLADKGQRQASAGNDALSETSAGEDLVARSRAASAFTVGSTSGGSAGEGAAEAEMKELAAVAMAKAAQAFRAAQVRRARAEQAARAAHWQAQQQQYWRAAATQHVAQWQDSYQWQTAQWHDAQQGAWMMQAAAAQQAERAHQAQ